MDKRLTKSDYLFILLFIFMLICVLGAFFYGMRLGTSRTETKYNTQLQQKQQQEKGLPAYHQSYLVSFYHTVYLPFREFNLKWQETMDELENNSGSADASSLMKEMSKLASEKYDALINQTQPASSPLLVEGHQNDLKSLKLFADAAKRIQGSANSVSSADLLKQIDKDAYFTEAMNFALTAQRNYFEAIVQWQNTTEKNVQGMDLATKGKLSLEDWPKLSLNVKDYYISTLLASGKHFVAYTPQDAAFRIEELIASGQAKKLQATTVSQVLDILIGTDAIRPGDFVRGKSKWYAKETLPQLPFFSKME